MITAWMQQTSRPVPKGGRSVVAVAQDNAVLGLIAIADKARPTSAAAVARLQTMSVDTVMLTGDNEATARAIGDALGIRRIARTSVTAGQGR